MNETAEYRPDPEDRLVAAVREMDGCHGLQCRRMRRAGQ